MKKKQEIVNQIFFVFVVLFIIFLLWGYGSGWLGVRADITQGRESKNFISTTFDGLDRLRQKPIFTEEVRTPSEKVLEGIF
jgi:hypothetical protein